MTDAIQVITTTADRQSAQAIGDDLVANRLAACVQVDGPLTSVYRWQGKVETAEEWRCTIKTTRWLHAAVERRIRELHAYAEPEIVMVEIHGGSPSYLRWLEDQVRKPDEAGE
jgi:periplasmic divalent cation tolerance protein